MITGDAVLTAAEVARQVGIIRRSSSSKKRTVYRIQERGDGSVSNGGNIEDPFLHFECKPFGRNVDKKAALPLSHPMIKDLLQKFKQGEASFCISGDALVSLAHRAVKMQRFSKMPSRSSTLDETNLLLSPASQTVLKQLVPLVSVFARHAPHQKEAVIAAYNHGGFQTLMCGYVQKLPSKWEFVVLGRHFLLLLLLPNVPPHDAHTHALCFLLPPPFTEMALTTSAL